MAEKRIENKAQSQWIRKYVEDRSFADVGGLWGTIGEKVTLAHKIGASKVAMVDTMLMHNKWWEAFLQHAEAQGLERDNIDCIVADLERHNFVKVAGTYDYVHCAGVLYHVPNPLAVLHNLVKMARQYLSMSTQVIPDRIENSQGVLEIPAGQALFIPGLNERQKAVLREYYDSQNYKVTNINRGNQPYYVQDKEKFHYGPSYWLPTRRMIETLFEIMGVRLLEVAYLSDHGAAFLVTKEH